LHPLFYFGEVKSFTDAHQGLVNQWLASDGARNRFP